MLKTSIPDPKFLTFNIHCKLWTYVPKNKDDKGSWVFVTLPKKTSREVLEKVSHRPRRGFGAVKVVVTIGNTRWGTSMFPDTSQGAYILPIKKEVRKKENISDGDSINITLEIVGLSH